MDAKFLLIPLVLAAVWALVTYNGFVRKRNRCATASSSVDVNLKKRHDLIPNLVSTVRGYMTHEAEVLERVTRLRSEAQSLPIDDPQRAAVEAQLGLGLATIMARFEDYPELVASQNAMHLQRTLTELEEQISAARRAYNAAVETLNNGIEMFPSKIVAGMMGLQQARFFEAVESERAAVRVKLNDE